MLQAILKEERKKTSAHPRESTVTKGIHLSLLCSALVVLSPWLFGATALAQNNPNARQQPQANGSLFNSSASQALGSLFYDVKARNVGDIVTISVLESTQSSIEASSDSARKSDATFGVANFGGLGRRLMLSSVLPGVDPNKLVAGNGAHTFSGKGTVARDSKFTTTIAARVKEVLPNGDMVIEASKIVEVNREKQTVTLSGIVRSRDISTDNVVLSSDVADLKVLLSGKGFVADANRPGWLFRILQKLAPF